MDYFAIRPFFIILCLTSPGYAINDFGDIFRNIFRKVANMELESRSPVILPNLSLVNCAKRCIMETGYNCRSFDYDHSVEKCTLHNINANAPTDELVNATKDTKHASRIGLRWLVIPLKKLRTTRVTYVNRVLKDILSLPSCIAECEAEVSFYCHSVDFNSKEFECTLHSSDVYNSSNLLTPALNVDHYETNYLRNFQRKLPSSNVRYHSRSKHHNVLTLEGCARYCALETVFKCRAFGYLLYTKECWLSERESHVDNINQARLYSSQLDYYERIPEGTLAKFINYGLGSLRPLHRSSVYLFKKLGLTVEQCADKCLNETTFRCMSFDFRPSDGMCGTSEYMTANVHGLQPSADIFHLEMIEKWLVYFYVTPFAVLSGSNKKHYNRVSPDRCAELCVKESDFICRSFDYQAVKGTCFLHSKTGNDVGGLYKRWLIAIHHFEMKPLNDCGGVLTARNGDFASPNWPREYNHKMNCTWNISTTKNKVIRIRFTHLKLAVQSWLAEDCNDQVDRLTVIDPGKPGQPLKQCLPVDTTEWTSTSNKISVHFTADSINTAQGFRAFYYTEWPCKGTILTENEGEFASPNWPNRYTKNTKCQWLIEAPKGMKITLAFDSFNLESHGPIMCSDKLDHVTVYDGRQIPSLVIGRFCGDKLPRAMTSTGRHLLITFESNTKTELQGFHAKYQFYGETIISKNDDDGESGRTGANHADVIAQHVKSVTTVAIVLGVFLFFFMIITFILCIRRNVRGCSKRTHPPEVVQSFSSLTSSGTTCNPRLSNPTYGHNRGVSVTAPTEEVGSSRLSGLCSRETGACGSKRLHQNLYSQSPRSFRSENIYSSPGSISSLDIT
ncbi:uncharacterized protein LOC141908279 isoform X2 [Tubulanus polymorphus]|uniref:uncharacterized protein LOC141908279 isoform X2 n=1 Tax=Tubulanus polymorphus TaxID=672921 RepID=UPI003DA598F5